MNSCGNLKSIDLVRDGADATRLKLQCVHFINTECSLFYLLFRTSYSILHELLNKALKFVLLL